jgi:hypothetical protein
LLSLFDWKYLPQLASLTDEEDTRIRVWDSGGYETGDSDDVSTVLSALPQSQAWSKQLYVEAAKSIPWNGKDILVNLDTPSPSMPISGQVREALELYDEIKGTYLKDILIHFSESPHPHSVVAELEPFLDQIDIIGFTEKEIAPTWLEGARFLKSFRSALNALTLPRSVPIHIFGCFDPKSVIYFSFAGADIFDGLTWHRYFFADRTTYYKREFEFRVTSSELSPEKDIPLSIMLHNIREIEQLRADLVYARTVGDNAAFLSDLVHLNKAL